MKKFAAIIITIALLVSFAQLPVWAASDYSYTVSGSTATITKYNGSASFVTVPETLDGYTVTAIGPNAFSNNSAIVSVTLPSGLLSIGDGAFTGCSKLASMNIPAKVTYIGDTIFYYSMAMSSITVDSANANYASIDGVLFDKKITTLLSYPAAKAGAYAIPSTVTAIDDGAFAYAVRLSSVSIPTSVKTIGNQAFDTCNGLLSVNIGRGVTSIGARAFSSCSALTSVSIPDSVTYIGTSAFNSCTILRSVIIGSGVTYIGNAAFANCPTLLSAFFSGNAPTADNTIFTGAAGLFKVYYASGNTTFTNPWYGYTTTTFSSIAAPTMSITPTTPISGSVVLTITYPAEAATKLYQDTTGAWLNYTGPVNISSNGTVYAYCLDASGMPSPTASITISNIDKTAPTATISYSTTQPTNGTVVATLIPSETVTVTNNSGSLTHAFTENGTFTFTFVDGAGLTGSATATVNNIDKTGTLDPVITPSKTLKTNSDVTITITYPSDAIARKYSLDGGTTWNNYTIPLVFSTNGAVMAKCQDTAGNWSNTVAYNVTNIDRTHTNPANPTYSLSTNGPAHNVTVTVVYPNDATTREYSNDNGATWKSYTTPLTAGLNGTLLVRCSNTYGFYSDIITITISNIDLDAPAAPTITADKVTITSGKVTITINYSADSVVQQYSLDQGKTWKDYFAPIAFTKNGTIQAIGQDAAGNWSTITTYNITNLDNTPPTVKGVTHMAVYNSTRTITFDEGSATLNDVPIVSGKMVTASGKYILLVVDNLGNYTHIVFYIDKTRPVITAVQANKKAVVSGGTYKTSKVTVTIKDGFLKSVVTTLNGKVIKQPAKGVYTAKGLYVITAVDKAGNVGTYTFRIK